MSVVVQVSEYSALDWGDEVRPATFDSSHDESLHELLCLCRV